MLLKEGKQYYFYAQVFKVISIIRNPHVVKGITAELFQFTSTQTTI